MAGCEVLETGRLETPILLQGGLWYSLLLMERKGGVAEKNDRKKPISFFAPFPAVVVYSVSIKLI